MLLKRKKKGPLASVAVFESSPSRCGSLRLQQLQRLQPAKKRAKISQTKARLGDPPYSFLDLLHDVPVHFDIAVTARLLMSKLCASERDPFDHWSVNRLEGKNMSFSTRGLSWTAEKLSIMNLGPARSQSYKL